MNRRNALSTVGLIVGGTLVGSQLVLTGCKPTPKSSATGLLNDDQIALMDEVADTILPKTAASPGAKEALVGAYMNVMVTDCLDPDDQKLFVDGIQKLNDRAKAKAGNDFIHLNIQERHDLLLELDKEASASKDPHYYRLFKELSMRGYFTSEPGETIALVRVDVPGHYDPCVPLTPGQRAFS